MKYRGDGSSSPYAVEILATGTHRIQGQLDGTAVVGDDGDVAIADAPPVTETRPIATEGTTTGGTTAAVTTATTAAHSDTITTGDGETDEILRLLEAVKRAVNDKETNEVERQVLAGSIGTGQVYIACLRKTITGLQEQIQIQTQKEQGNIRSQEDADSWASTPTRRGSPPNAWSKGSPFTSTKPNTITATTPIQTQARIRTRPGDSRRQRQILVRVRNNEERAAMLEKSAEEVVKGLRNPRYTNTEQLQTVNRLRSGDILLQVASVEAREALEREDTWLRSTTGLSSAIVIKKSYPVMVHAMQISRFDTNDQAAIKTSIEGENRGLHPGLKVIRARWPASAWKSTNGQKRYSSLIVDVSTPEMADRLIAEGLTCRNEAKLVVKFDRMASTIQCYRCQSYGHMAMACINGVRCAECNQNHDTREHNSAAPTAAKACGPCQQEGHTAYSPTCPQRVKEWRRTTKRIARKAPFYDSCQQVQLPLQQRKDEQQRKTRPIPTGSQQYGASPPAGAISPSIRIDREINSLTTKLRKRFDDIKRTGRKPDEIESALIKVQMDEIKALKQRQLA